VTMATQLVSNLTRLLLYILMLTPHMATLHTHPYPLEPTYIITITTQGHFPYPLYCLSSFIINQWNCRLETSKDRPYSSISRFLNRHKSVVGIVVWVAYQTLNRHKWRGLSGRVRWCHHQTRERLVVLIIDPHSHKDLWTLLPECGEFR